MESIEWSLPAVFEVVAAAAHDRDMLVWKDTRRTYAEVAARTRNVAAFLQRQRHRRPPRAERARALGVRPGARCAAPLQLPRIHRSDARLLRRPSRSVQRQPALPTRGDPQPARHGGRRGGRLPPLARSPRRRGDECAQPRARRRRRRVGSPASRRQHELRGRREQVPRRLEPPRPVSRRSLPRVHGRHDRFTEGCALAPGRHLRRGDGRRRGRVPREPADEGVGRWRHLVRRAAADARGRPMDGVRGDPLRCDDRPPRRHRPVRCPHHSRDRRPRAGQFHVDRRRRLCAPPDRGAASRRPTTSRRCTPSRRAEP